MKLLPKSLRVALNFRRTCRKKIHERIIAVSGKYETLVGGVICLFIHSLLAHLQIQKGEA